MKIIFNKKNIYINIPEILIIIILFINATLYNSNSVSLFIRISIIFIILSWLYIVKHFGVIKTILKTKYFWWFTILFMMYWFYGYIFHVYGNYNWDYLLMLYVTVLTLVILFTAIPDEMKLKSINNICIYCSIAICSYILIHEYNNIISGGTRIGESGSGNVNTIGTYLSVFSIPILHQIIIEKKNKQIPIFLIQLFFMLLTGSKKALLFIFIGLIILYIYKNGLKVHKYIRFIVLISLFIYLIISVDYFYEIIGYRIINFLGELGFNISGAKYSYSTEARLSMYKVAPSLFKQHPIFGGGWGYFAEKSGLHVYSHSNIIEILITFGLIGLIYYYSIFFSIIKKSIKKVGKKEGIIALCYIIVLFVNDTSVITFCQVPICYFAIFISYLFANLNLEQLDKKIKREEVKIS